MSVIFLGFQGWHFRQLLFETFSVSTAVLLISIYLSIDLALVIHPVSIYHYIPITTLGMSKYYSTYFVFMKIVNMYVLLFASCTV